MVLLAGDEPNGWPGAPVHCAPAGGPPLPRSPARPWWASLPDDELLDVRLCDLDLRVAGSRVAPLVARLERELARAGARRFRPYAWLSTGWFTPHGLTGFAIPFYVSHPRLVQLERRMLGYAEGGDAMG